MKIGILTYHCVPNFGAQLQATSMVGYLKKLGHDPVVLNWYPYDLEERFKKTVSAEQIRMHDRYTSEYLPITSLCQSEEQLIDVVNAIDLDAVILGSDALFKYIPQRERRWFSYRKLKFCQKTVLSCEDIKENPFFGGFLSKLKKNIPAVGFSISSQNCNFKKLNREEKNKIKKMLGNLGVITVRDEWTKFMVEFITGRENIRVTPDPVFSFRQNFYGEFPSREKILNKFNLPSNYVLLSFSNRFVPTDYVGLVAEELLRRGLTPVAFPMPERLIDHGLAYKVDNPLSPLDWYLLIVYSLGYIGERMHPIVVSLHNANPFFSFDEYGCKNGVFKKRFDKCSSKTFHIINAAGLDSNWFPLKGGGAFPPAEQVVDLLLSFDKRKCRAFAQEKYESFVMELNMVLESLDR